MASNSTPIRVGVVGLSASGWASMALAPALLHPTLASRYRLTAVSTTSETSASDSAKKYSTPGAEPVQPFSGATTAIANYSEVDFVMIAIRAPRLMDAVLPVISAKKNFFIEWPAGLNLQETKEIAQHAKLHGTKSIVGLQGRYTPVVRKIKDYIKEEKIGKVLSSSIIAMAPREYGFWGPEVNERNDHTISKDQGTTMLEIALGHELDILTHVLGDFAAVSAISSIIYPTATISSPSGSTRTAPVTTPDHVACSGVLKSGAVVSVIWRGGYSSNPGRTQFVWVIDGETGSIRVESDAVGGAFIHISDPRLFLDGKEVIIEELTEEDLRQGGSPARNVRAALAEFADGGDDPSYATIEDAVKLRTLLKAIDDSARGGLRVTLA